MVQSTRITAASTRISTRIVNTYQDVKSISNRDLSNVVNKTRRNSYMDMLLDVKFDADIEKIESVLSEALA